MSSATTIDWSVPPPQQRDQLSQQSASNTTSWNQSQQQGGNQNVKLEPGVFTEKESQALKQVKKNVDRTRSLGFIIGSCSMFYLLTRRLPGKVPSLLARAGYSFLGGIGGGLFLMPIGVMYSKPILKQVEDPQHMAETLRMRVEGRKKEWEQGKFNKPSLEAGVNPNQKSNETRTDSIINSTSYGEDRNTNSGIYNSASTTNYNPNLNYDSTSNQDYSSVSSSDYASETSSLGETNSRWEQLRSQRNVEPSSWERIRQDNAREALNNRARDPNEFGSQIDGGISRSSGRNTGAESSWQEDGSSASGPILADPTFGKGTSEGKERERREFEENMERERRGMDSGTGPSSRRW